MIDLTLFISGFIAGITVMGMLIIWVDNREWVKDLKKKHNLGGYQPKYEIKSDPPQDESIIYDECPETPVDKPQIRM